MLENKKITSILILNYNGEKYLKRFFDNLGKCNLNECDIYFIENGSKDTSLEIAKKYIHQNKIIINDKNIGIAGGFNSGLAKIIDHYEYIILLANDILISEGWYENLIQPIKDNKEIGISSSIILQEDGKTIEIGGICLFNILMGVFGHYLGFENFSYFKNKNIYKPYKVAFSAMASMAIRSSTLKEVGLFDDTFWEMFMDIDLSWRVRLMGYDIVCVPGSYGIHIGDTRYTKRKASNIELGILFLYLKFLNRLNLFFYFPILIASRLAFSIFYIFISYEISAQKIKNIFYFLWKIKDYWKIRNEIQKIRRVSDNEIFKYNNVSIFTFRFPFSIKRHKEITKKGIDFDLKFR
jgi:hypothetical protein